MLAATLTARTASAAPASAAQASVVAKQPDTALAQLLDWQRQLAGAR